MSVSNVSSNAYTSNMQAQVNGTGQSKEAKTTEATTTETTAKAADTGVVYEPSANAATPAKNTKNPKVDSATIEKLKADADQRMSQLRGIVEQLISKQGKAAENASPLNDLLKAGESDDSIWNKFRQGIKDGSITVDEATAKKAAEDISEDGYWGVKQTSERILDFAKALTGGDSSKAEQMRDAIKKGFDSAAKLWGDELPDISKKTYEAVMKGLDDWKNESSNNLANNIAAQAAVATAAQVQ